MECVAPRSTWRSRSICIAWIIISAVLCQSLWIRLRDTSLPWRRIAEDHPKETRELLMLFGLLLFHCFIALVVICMSYRGEVSPLLDRYNLGKKLGNGAFGSVYRAIKTIKDEEGSAEQVFALKVIELHDVGGANDAIGEAMRLACIDHKNVVGVHEQFVVKESILGSSLMFFNTSPFKLCIALELCSGDLETEISRWASHNPKRPDWPQLLRIFQEMVEGVEAMHSKNIIHCDLKPANIFISSDHKHIKIGDLGISQTVRKRRVITQGLDFSGTPGYIAPEVWEHDAHGSGFSTLADSWSLACIMFDIAHPTEEGGWSIADILGKSDFGFSADHEDDLALFLADPRIAKPPVQREVLDHLYKHSSLKASKVAQDVVKHCLVKDPNSRWGCIETLHALRPLGHVKSVAINRSYSDLPS